MAIGTAVRLLARGSLRWYYRRVDVIHREKASIDGPLLVVSNHPNTLMDVLCVLETVPRPVSMTGKATLFVNPIMGWFLHRLGMIPLRRAIDEKGNNDSNSENSSTSSRDRNQSSFDMVSKELAKGGAVLVFPEGVSHSEAHLQPLRTGAARMALDARGRGVHGVKILPMSGTFERKWSPRSRVAIAVGEPIEVDGWVGDHHALTDEIFHRMQDLTLNCSNAQELRDTMRLAKYAIAGRGIATGLEGLDREGVPFDRVYQLTQILLGLPCEYAAELGSMMQLAGRLKVTLVRANAKVEDADLNISWESALWFLARESILAILGLAVTILSRVVHGPVFALALRSARNTGTPEDTAMTAVLTGLIGIPVVYALAGLIVGHVFGAVWGVAFIMVLPAIGTVDLAYRDRMRRVVERVRAWWYWRLHPIRQRILVERLGRLAARVRSLPGADGPMRVGP